MPRLRVFAGPNGSGKSTLLDVLPRQWLGVYVNADDIERDIRAHGGFDLAAYELAEAAPSRFERLRVAMKSAGRLSSATAGDVSERLSLDGAEIRLEPDVVDSYVAATLADFLRAELLDAGKDFTFETVMSHESKVDFLAEARRRGYRTYLYFVATGDPLINVNRVRQRVARGGHRVGEPQIRKRYARSISLLRSACETANRAYVFDNSGVAHRLIVEITDGTQLVVHASPLPAWFVATDLWLSFQP